MSTKHRDTLKTLEDFTRQQERDSSSHDWWHVYRVNHLAKKINRHEKGDQLIVSTIALLHNFFDYKFNDHSDTTAIKDLLAKLNVAQHFDQKSTDNICYSIQNLSFSKSGFSKVKLSKEGQIVQDAHNLDAMGAIVIARTFAYGEKLGRPMYDPGQGIIEVTSNEEYQKKGQRDTINHFYEKLLKLKGLMNTKTGEKVAIKRHQFMEEYLRQFFVEWNAEDVD